MNIAKVYNTEGEAIIGCANDKTIADAIQFCFGEAARIGKDWAVTVDGKKVGQVVWTYIEGDGPKKMLD